MNRKTAGYPESRRPPSGPAEQRAHLNRKVKVEWDWLDRLLLAGIIVLAIVVVILSMPLLASAGTAVWRGCGAVLRFWQWTWSIWTTLGVLTLSVLLWIQQRSE